jgi:hypothetical protein
MKNSLINSFAEFISLFYNIPKPIGRKKQTIEFPYLDSNQIEKLSSIDKGLAEDWILKSNIGNGNFSKSETKYIKEVGFSSAMNINYLKKMKEIDDNLFKQAFWEFAFRIAYKIGFLFMLWVIINILWWASEVYNIRRLFYKKEGKVIPFPDDDPTSGLIGLFLLSIAIGLVIYFRDRAKKFISKHITGIDDGGVFFLIFFIFLCSLTTSAILRTGVMVNLESLFIFFGPIIFSLAMRYIKVSDAPSGEIKSNHRPEK